MPPFPSGGGGTGATNIIDARNNLEVPSTQDLLQVESELQETLGIRKEEIDTLATSVDTKVDAINYNITTHNHTGGTNGPVIPITGGGTGGTTPTSARINIGAAPNGYGLGDGVAQLITDFTSITAGGFYRCFRDECIGAPPAFASAILVMPFDGNFAAAIAMDSGGNMYKCLRIDATWGSWTAL